MAPNYLKTVFLVLLLMYYFRCGKSDFDPSKCLKVPVSEFVGEVRSTIIIVRLVTRILLAFSGTLPDFRVSNAVSDCLDLMDLSEYQLTRTISAVQTKNGKDNSTGNICADMKTWLSGALTNPDTCNEGFEGTTGIVIVKPLIARSLGQIASLVYNILSNVQTPPSRSGGGGRKLLGVDEFPDWFGSRDRNLLQAATGAMADVVVAADGTGKFTTIEEAIAAAPENSLKRFVIYIKRGVYNETVEISKKKLNIMMIGDGVTATVITGNNNFNDGWTTYRSATFAVKGQGFIARDITFENTAGPDKHQAVAFRSDSDLSVLFRCAVKGFQDTLYAHSQRQFYRQCKITGTVDFIFGDGAVVFQNCEILARQGLPNQKNTITAHGRKKDVEDTGFSIQFCNISTEPNVVKSTQTYLGRPWKLFSRTVIMQSYISNVIRPEGWLEWNGDFALDTLFYAEYANYGPGAVVVGRVKWPGYHVFNSPAQASNFTVSQFISGDKWLPSTRVNYTPGLGVRR